MAVYLPSPNGRFIVGFPDSNELPVLNDVQTDVFGFSCLHCFDFVALKKGKPELMAFANTNLVISESSTAFSSLESSSNQSHHTRCYIQNLRCQKIIEHLPFFVSFVYPFQRSCVGNFHENSQRNSCLPPSPGHTWAASATPGGSS